MEEVSCTDNTAVVTGGVGGVMGLIILIQSVMIVLLLQHIAKIKATRATEVGKQAATAHSKYTEPPLRVSTRWW